MKRSRALLTGVCSVLSLLPIAFTIWFVEGFSLKVPIADHWALVTLYGQIVTGQAHLADFLRPHNGLHVILVGRLVLFALAYLTDLTFRGEIYLGLSLVLVTAWMLRATARSSFPPERGRAAAEVASLFTVLLLFAPQQRILWTWSIGFFHFLENASVVGAVWALALAQPRIGLAILFCATATFNRFEGLLSWVVLAFAGAAAVGRADVLQPGLVSLLQRVIATWYVSAYSVTASLVAIATVHLLALVFSRNWNGRIPRTALGTALTALGLGLFATNYAYALPELLAKRSEGRADLYCVELAAYMDESNTCALRSEGEKLLERARLRWIRHDVTFEDAAPSEEPALANSEIHRIVMSGWATLPNEKAGTVLLEFGERRRFFAQASRLHPERGGVLWSVSIPRDAFDAPTDVVHAWAYDRARGQFPAAFRRSSALDPMKPLRRTW